MIIGTHTAEGEQNSLLITKVRLPKQDTEIDARKYDEEKGEMGGFGGVGKNIDTDIDTSIRHNCLSLSLISPLGQVIVNTPLCIESASLYIFYVLSIRSRPAFVFLFPLSVKSL